MNSLKKEMDRKARELKKYQQYRRMTSPREGPLDSASIRLQLNHKQNETMDDGEDFTQPEVPKFYKYLIRRKSVSKLDEDTSAAGMATTNTWSHIGSHSKQNSDYTEEFEGGTLKFGDIRRQQISVGGGNYN